MNDLIDRQKAIDALSTPHGILYPIRTIEKLPSVQSQPEIIMCKDCKHWNGRYCHNKWWGDGYGNYTPPVKTEEGYCDWAERKED